MTEQWIVRAQEKTAALTSRQPTPTSQTPQAAGELWWVQDAGGIRGHEIADPWTVPALDAAVEGFFGPVAAAGGASLGAAGGLMVGGMEFMGFRVYDPGVRGFVSVDPLAPVAGAGWSGNPYAFAGNDPVGLVDPWGLSPISPAGLEAYNDAHPTSWWERAKEFVANNWEYAVGGLAVAAGLALMFTGVGGVAGVALMGLSEAFIAGGASTIQQKYNKGSVNWTSVGIESAVGFAIGLAGGGAARVIANRSGSLFTQNVGSAMTSGGFDGGSRYAMAPGEHTVSGFAKSVGRSSLTSGMTGALGAKTNSSLRIEHGLSRATADLGSSSLNGGLDSAVNFAFSTPADKWNGDDLLQKTDVGATLSGMGSQKSKNYKNSPRLYESFESLNSNGYVTGVDSGVWTIDSNLLFRGDAGSIHKKYVNDLDPRLFNKRIPYTMPGAHGGVGGLYTLTVDEQRSGSLFVRDRKFTPDSTG